MRRLVLVLTLLAPSGLAHAQSATATSPSASSASTGAAAGIAPSGGTVSPQSRRMLQGGGPAVGGNTETDLKQEKQDDQKSSICKGC